MKKKSGIVILAALFVGLFALLSGFIAGTIVGGDAAMKKCESFLTKE